jgi:hemin uptake protein HemP
MSTNNIFRNAIYLVLVILALSACGTDDPPAAVLQARSLLADQLGVPAEEITILSVEEVEWADSCFGLGEADEMCAAEITPGWRVILDANGQEYEVRSNKTGTLIRSPQLPAAVLQARSLLADQLGVPAEEITILSVEEVEWTDSCFGLGGAAEMCAAEMTPGWRVIFDANGQRYEVRSNKTGTLIRSPQL